MEENKLRRLFDAPNLVYLEEKNGSLFLEGCLMVVAEKVGDFIFAEEDYSEFYNFIEQNKNFHSDKFISMVLRDKYSHFNFNAYSLKPNYGLNVDGLTRHHGGLYRILGAEDGVH